MTSHDRSTWNSIVAVVGSLREVDVRTETDLPLDGSAVERLRAFAHLVRSSPHNLLSQRALDELEVRHIPECIGLAAMLPTDARTVLDVGTGGGFPGMVLAIARPDLSVTLLDSTSKKIAFLDASAAELGVEVSTLDGRSEDLIRGREGSFDVVTARAVAPLDRLLGWTLPWVRPGGFVFAIKGERWEDELRAALPALRRARASVVTVTEPGERVSTGEDAAVVGTRPRVVIIRAPG